MELLTSLISKYSYVLLARLKDIENTQMGLGRGLDFQSRSWTSAILDLDSTGSVLDVSWTLVCSPVSYSLPIAVGFLSVISSLNIKLVFCPSCPPALLNLHLSTLPSPSISLFSVIRPANLNLLPIWVGCTSGSYLRGTILLFSPCTGTY